MPLAMARRVAPSVSRSPIQDARRKAANVKHCKKKREESRGARTDALGIVDPAAASPGKASDRRPAVHDPARPIPPVVTPAAQPGGAPSDAIVLFDGKDLSKWQSPAWKVENGYVQVIPGKGDLVSKEKFGDVQLHIEWATPVVLTGNSQERGNSGVFLQDRYEVQVLDSYQNRTYADGQAGAIYGQWPPLVNAARKPG